MRDRIAAIVGSTEQADEILQLFQAIYNYETPPLDDPEQQPDAPGIMRSYRVVRYQSVDEPAPNEPGQTKQ